MQSTSFYLTWSPFYIKKEFAELCALTPNCLTHQWYALYPLLLCALRAFTLINKHLKSLFLALWLCCFNRKVRQPCFACVLQLTINPPSLSSLLFYHIKLFYILFSFFYFKLLVTPLFIQLFCNNIFTFSVLFLS